jgi:hypothetical protein
LIPLIREESTWLYYQKQYFRPTTYTNIPLIVYKEAVKKVDSKAEAEEKPMTLYK